MKCNKSALNKVILYIAVKANTTPLTAAAPYAVVCANQSLPAASQAALDSNTLCHFELAATRNDRAPGAWQTNTRHHHPTTTTSRDHHADRETQTAAPRTHLPPTATARSPRAHRSLCAYRS